MSTMPHCEQRVCSTGGGADSSVLLSVCVAVFNVQDYLEECLESLRSQTLASAEFIIVDDCSTDGCLEIARRFETQDRRFKVISHPQNKGCLAVRKTGIEEAVGVYTVFLDGDDRFSTSTSLATILQAAEKENVDILHFTSELLDASEPLNVGLLTWLNGTTGGSTQSSSVYLEDVFVKHARCFNIWNKVYRSSILKKAAHHIPDERFVCAEDAYLTFLFGYFASSFLSVKTAPIYAYRVGCGISTRPVELQNFLEHYVKEPLCCNWLETFLYSQAEQSSFYARCVQELRGQLIRTSGHRLKALPEKEWPQAFDAMIANNEIEDVVSELAHVFRGPDSFGQLASNVIDAKTLSVPGKSDAQTVALIYNRYYEGGVERVISRQIPMLISLGYRVVLFTDEIAPEREYALPEGVTRVVLPKSYDLDRARALKQALREKKIDCVLYHQASSWDCCIWDLMLMRLLQVHVIVHLHELPFSFLSVDPQPIVHGFESARPAIYRLASRLVVLDRTQEAYFRGLGVNATYVPNPLTYMPSEASPPPRSDQRFGVYWVGRLDDAQKNYLGALEIFKRLVARDSAVQCFLVGPEFDKGAGQRVLSYIRENALEDNVHWLGAIVDVDHYLRKARVLLVTSRFESFMMVLAEAKICGTPVVMYDLPYLELRQSGKGMSVVPQGSIDQAAAQVLEILKDDNRCNQMISDSVRDIEEFYSNYDLKCILKSMIDAPDYCENTPVLVERLTAQYQQQQRFMRLALERSRKETEVLLAKLNRRRTKKQPFTKVLKYLILSRVAFSRDKRRHYRSKLWRVVTGF